jgi:hypothetical protein
MSEPVLTRPRSTPPPVAPYIDGDSDNTSSEEESEYEVQALLADDIRTINGMRVRHYLVKWVGYDDDQNSWEPAVNVSLGTIRNYEARKKERLRLLAAERAGLGAA